MIPQQSEYCNNALLMKKIIVSEFFPELGAKASKINILEEKSLLESMKKIEKNLS